MRPAAADAGAVHDDIQATHGFRRGRHRRIDAALRADIAALESGARAEGLRRLLALRILDVEQCDLAAAGNEQFCNCKAQARRPTGDDCAHFVEIHSGGLPVWFLQFSKYGIARLATQCGHGLRTDQRGGHHRVQDFNPQRRGMRQSAARGQRYSRSMDDGGDHCKPARWAVAKAPK